MEQLFINEGLVKGVSNLLVPICGQKAQNDSAYFGHCNILFKQHYS